MAKSGPSLSKTTVNNIKALGIDMITNAGSGHPGVVLSAAPALTTLFAHHLRINPKDPNWLGRDRFVMSGGHGSALLYSTMFIAGFDIPLETLKTFRRAGSKLTGHPEYGVLPGIDCTTGPLGQGFATAVGMAIGETILNQKFSTPVKSGFKTINDALFDYHTYVMCGDGDLMEGVSYEAASIAGRLGLGKLIVLYDDNDMTLDGPLNKSFNENVAARFAAQNWQVIEVKDSDDYASINKAIERAKADINRPSLICIKSILGKDSPQENTNKAHGQPLTTAEVSMLKSKLNMRDLPFTISNEAISNMGECMSERNRVAYNTYQNKLRDYLNYDTFGKDLNNYINGPLKVDVAALIYDFDSEIIEPLRDINGKVMNIVGDNLPFLISTNADLFSSTKTYLNNHGNYDINNRLGRNVWCGIREHAMGAIANGLALVGFRPVASTFLSFSDYLKPSIRLAALMKLPVTYVFTHDSFNIGGDGPTHIPIEQLTMLRSTPDLRVYRPADAKEVVGSWNHVINNPDLPSALIISKSKLPLLAESAAKGVYGGAYIVSQEPGPMHAILLATGSEVSLAINVASTLATKGYSIRVVSMPSSEVFDRQSEEYKNAIIPPGIKTIAIEAASDMSWFKYVTDKNCIISANTFGISGTEEEQTEYYGFTLNKVTLRVANLINTK